MQNNGTYNYVEIEPVKATVLDAEDSTQLFITKIVENGFNSATIHWELKSAPVEEVRDGEEIIVHARPGITYLSGTYRMVREEYDGWVDNEYPFTVLLNNYPNLILKQ